MSSRPHISPRRAHSGVTLILTLAMVVLITALVLAFLTFATSNQQIEASRAGQVRAEQAARSGADYVTASFISEITSTTYSSTNVSPESSAGPPMYVPTQNKYAIPQRYVSGNVSGSAFYNLIRQSLPTASGGNDPYASTDSTATPSANGRYISQSRWNAPVLLGGSGFTANNQLPNWIYVDRLAGPLTPPLTSTTTPGVISRFAYNVYDIGGLLDANSAGYPASENNNVLALKGTEAGANLTNAPGASSSSVDALRVTFADANYTGNPYANRMDAMAANGWRSSVAVSTNFTSLATTTTTNSIFASRQELLRYAQAENTGLLPALPYLTTFSRALSAPAWGPTTNFGSGAYTYLTSRNTAADTNRFFPNVRYGTGYKAGKTATAVTFQWTHYNDDGTTVANTQAKAGDLLMPRKFSLAKLNWLSYKGINSAAFNSSLTAAQQATAVVACFGLIWNPKHPANGVDSTAGVYPAWEYVGSSSTTPSSPPKVAIAQLNNGAGSPVGDNREPNFFELLKAGILSGSLGATAFSSGSDKDSCISRGGTYNDATTTDFQIIRIGANIIDQWDTDSYPTAIAIGDPLTSGQSITMFGIEDLPYLNDASPMFYWATRSLTNALGPVQTYMVYELWNPHTNSTPVGSKYPTSFALWLNTNDAAYDVTCCIFTNSAFTTNCSQFAGISGGASIPPPTFTSTPAKMNINNNVLANSTIYYTSDPQSTDPGTSYRQPHLIRTAVSPTTSIGNIPANSQFPNNVTGTYFCSSATSAGTNYFPATYLPSTNTTGNNCMHFNPNYLVVSLGYANPDTTTSGTTPWIPYTTFLGDREGAGKSGLGGAYGLNIGMSTIGPVGTGGGVNTLGKADPRSFRFDGYWGSPAPETTLRTNDAVTANNPYQAIYAHPYFFTNNTTLAPPAGLPNGAFAAASMAANANSATPGGASYEFNYDADGAVRPADYYYGNGNPYNTNNMTGINARPAILNRPFHSVAEMGYAYRDMPFKTLDFFTSGSADAGLLELFALHDEPLVVAGKVNINTAQAPVLQALFDGSSGIDSAGALATNFVNYTHDATTGNPTNAVLNLGQISQLINTYHTTSSSDTKVNMEAPVRDISSATQSRTWNLLVDVVAQVGEFPIGQTGAGSFVVQGEKRYWLSVAIDRYTGQIIDEQLESVNE